uniref:4a-hydroxytetrahydrobiopterin dehydratase n=2 Tax=Aegilops tauschii subsp. strangulata TaxID=200361 RepID=A0A453PMM2_AEGTS
MNIEASPGLPTALRRCLPEGRSLGMEGRTLLRDQAAPSASAPTGRSASQATGDEAAAEVELSKRSCVSCNSKDLQAMSEDSAKTLLEQVTGWEVKNEGDILKLHRAWKVKSFAKGLEFFQLVAAVAEEEGSPFFCSVLRIHVVSLFRIQFFKCPLFSPHWNLTISLAHTDHSKSMHCLLLPIYQNTRRFLIQRKYQKTSYILIRMEYYQRGVIHFLSYSPKSPL